MGGGRNKTYYDILESEWRQVLEVRSKFRELLGKFRRLKAKVSDVGRG